MSSDTTNLGIISFTCIFTDGEPTLERDKKLIKDLRDKGYEVNVSENKKQNPTAVLSSENRTYTGYALIRVEFLGA